MVGVELMKREPKMWPRLYVSVAVGLLMGGACMLGGCANSGRKTNPKTVGQAYSGLGLSSISDADLKTYAPPQVPMTTKDHLKKFFSLRTPGSGILSPNGKELYFGWSVTGETQVWKLMGPNRFPIQMTTGQNPTYLQEITPDGRYLILAKDVDGQENPGIFLQPTSGGELIQVFQKPNVRANFNFMSKDGRFLYFTANDIKPDNMTIYRYGMMSRSIEQISNESGSWAVDDQSGDVLLLVKYIGSTGREYYELNLKTKTMEPLLGQNEYQSYVVAFSATPGKYFVLTNKFTDLQKLYIYTKPRTAGGRADWKLFGKQKEHEIESFQVNTNKTHLVLDYNRQGYMTSEVYKLNGQAVPLPQPQVRGSLQVGRFDWTGTKLSLSSSSATSPRQNMIYDLKQQKTQMWNFGSTPQLDAAEFADETLDFYTAQDGTQIPMFVMRPKVCQQKLCPVIVSFHGGPEGQSMAGFSGYKQAFAHEGFVLVHPNVRGSSGYGKKWLDADNGPRRLHVITDIQDCATHIRQNWKVNGISPKIGVMGGSYGGYSTLMAMSRFAGSYDAGAASVGMSDLKTFLMNTAPYRRVLRITEYGDPEKDAEALRQLSPITYVDSIKNPLMIIQGANDPRVPVGEAIQMKRVLDQKNIDAKLIIFADEGHGSAKLENQILEVGNILEFFKKHLASKSAGIAK